jgi:glucokinase
MGPVIKLNRVGDGSTLPPPLPAPDGPLVSPVLVGDIGGGTTRFGLAYPEGQLRAVSFVVNDLSGSIEDAIERYLHEHQVRPSAAILAVAGPVDGDEVAVISRRWRFRLSGLHAAFGFAVRAVNDFEAVACAIAGHRDCEIWSLGASLPARSGGARAVLGPGTGLGVAAILPLENNKHYIAASEGGHVSFGPASHHEELVFTRLRALYGEISAAIISGPGLSLLYLALFPDGGELLPEEIVRRARSGDGAAQTCIDMFVSLLGRFAGDTALMFKATAGIYLSGGLATGLKDVFNEAIFRAAFEAHPPHSELLARVPSFIVASHDAGLLGCAVLARQWLDGCL